VLWGACPVSAIQNLRHVARDLESKAGGGDANLHIRPTPVRINGEILAEFSTFVSGLSFTECPRWRGERLYIEPLRTHLNFPLYDLGRGRFSPGRGVWN
jgi:hypothetical protein